MYTKNTRLPIDEETPLLADNISIHDDRQSTTGSVSTRASDSSSTTSTRSFHFKTVTPLPWSQLSIMLLVLVAEPMTSQVISPFAPQVR